MLENLYKRNLEYFKTNLPNLYNFIVNENTDELRLVVDENNVNITVNNTPIYPENSLQFIDNMVDQYLEKPKGLSVLPFGNENKSKYSQVHQSFIDKLEVLFNEYKTEKPIYNSDCLNVLLIFGIGTGVQISNLLSKKDINHLIFIDINHKFFKASMYFVNWINIINEYSQKNKSITFIINNDLDNVVNNLINVLYSDKAMFTSYINTFESYKSLFFDEVLKKLRVNYQQLVLGWGFYDDELRSMKHSILNINQNIPFYCKDQTDTPFDCSIFIIANGPSLDKDIKFIKQYRDSAIILSCGSALSALEKYDITPDYHLEIERNDITYENLVQSNSKEYLSKVNFIGLNVIYPKVFSLFKTVKLVFRDNDAGTSLSNSIVGGLGYTNPTAANFALAFASKIGFKNIYLFGMDMGYFESKKHHSLKSGYYNEKSQMSTFEQKQTNIYLKANLSKDKIVSSNYILNWCKQRAENCIVNYNMKQKKDINYFNCSDGAYIEGTIPLESSLIKIKDGLKDNALLKLESFFEYPSHKEKQFKRNLKSEKKDINSVVSNILKLIKKLNYENRSEMYNFFYETYSVYLLHNVYKKDTQESLVFSLLRGTLLTIFTKMYICSILIPDFKDAKDFNKNAIEILKEFLEQLSEDANHFKLSIQKN